MNSPLACIQLVSEQAMPNLLPVLALQPHLLCHLTTPRTNAVSHRLAETFRRAGLEVEVETIGLSAMPSLAESRRAVARAIEICRDRGMSPVLNFTGGTKLMSIGAWETAKVHGVPSLYVNTQDEHFIDGETGDFARIAELLVDFSAAARRLRVDLVGYSNGVSRVTSGRDPMPLLPLAAMLLRDREMERFVWETMSGSDGFVKRALGHSGGTPRDLNQMLHMLETPLLGLPQEVADAAVACGLFEETRDGLRIASTVDGIDVVSEAQYLFEHRLAKSEYRERMTRLRDAVQFPVSFLSGAWLEVAAFNAMRSSGRFHDLRWSVLVGEKDGYDLEEDIIALDGVRLAYVSCKRSGRLHAHAEEIYARARRIGGTFSSCYYIIHEMPYGPAKDDLLNRCRALGNIRVIPSSALLTSQPFDHE